MVIPFTDFDWKIPSIPILAILAVYETLGLFRVGALSASLIDHGAHLGGMVTGIAGAGLIKWQVAQLSAKAEGMRQEKGAFGGNAPWGENKTEGEGK